MHTFGSLENIRQILYYQKKGPHLYIYTGCPTRNVPDFGRVFLMLKFIDITQNTHVES